MNRVFLTFLACLAICIGCKNTDFSGSGQNKAPDDTTSDFDRGRNIDDDGDAIGSDRRGRDDDDDDSGRGDGSNRHGSDSGARGEGGTLLENEVLIAERLPTFGLLVNDLTCGMCHLVVNGDIASTRSVAELEEGSNSVVNGTWFGASSIDVADQVRATGGFQENYSGIELPKKFPELDVRSSDMRGSIESMTGNVNETHGGNIFIAGTRSNPIRIKGDVLIRGDLVIKGYYVGRGNIYVDGNIYIPFDLKARTSAFPFPEDANSALRLAKKLARNSETDALGLATSRSIFIGDIKREQPAFHGLAGTVYSHITTPPHMREDALGVLDVYGWFRGGERGYRSQYENAFNCLTGSHSQRGSFNIVEAFLYAKQAIGGVARANTYVINGGVIADVLHVIARRARDYFVFPSTARGCSGGIHPVHKHPVGANYINYDWRIKAGLRILNRLDFGH